jgi:hypothetical protein
LQTHKFVVVKTEDAPDQLPQASDATVDETASGLTVGGEAEDIEVGASTDLTVSLEPG